MNMVLRHFENKKGICVVIGDEDGSPCNQSLYVILSQSYEDYRNPTDLLNHDYSFENDISINGYVEDETGITIVSGMQSVMITHVHDFLFTLMKRVNTKGINRGYDGGRDNLYLYFDCVVDILKSM